MCQIRKYEAVAVYVLTRRYKLPELNQRSKFKLVWRINFLVRKEDTICTFQGIRLILKYMYRQTCEDGLYKIPGSLWLFLFPENLFYNLVNLSPVFEGNPKVEHRFWDCTVPDECRSKLIILLKSLIDMQKFESIVTKLCALYCKHLKNDLLGVLSWIKLSNTYEKKS